MTTLPSIHFSARACGPWLTAVRPLCGAPGEPGELDVRGYRARLTLADGSTFDAFLMETCVVELAGNLSAGLMVRPIDDAGNPLELLTIVADELDNVHIY